ncbi:MULTISPECIES: 23S rRNA (adenine(2030)-N(6))-methyltransferase RlmJ [Asaia]|uniref:23S rRNA (adenine(2030)-N(6))-methyltransferase RlmJ n=1 Tax=Asaia TaxID=91914 RepID=UPI002555ABEC|nr:23S rRNA (adenine(2030)-N(6))-methyltransferase RlmJ [Asaia sp. HumB]MDL2170049.1 23S rRNA (adenine(2030)-N(6))-methyltransferase RlmJ [Asaia sp. HumB]
MNYRHAYHAGNFADMMKHGLLLVILRHLLRKPAGFCVLDTHSGCGLYDLDATKAQKTGEWREGIGAFHDAPALPETVPEELTDYLSIVRSFNAPDGPANRYPGSPALIASVLRPQDRLICCELHPDDARILKRNFRDQPQVAVHERDGYGALKAFLPPRDLKRGLVLMDPPFEKTDEFDTLATAMRNARRAFPMGIVAAWYPVKHRAPVRRFHDTLRDMGLRDIVDCSLYLRQPTDPARLNGCGLTVIAPPYRFEDQARVFLNSIAPILSPDGEGYAEVTRIVEE